MDLECVRLSDTIYRYRLVVHLGPYSEIRLIVAETGTTVTAWRTGEHSEVIHGIWESPFSNLTAAIEGVEHEWCETVARSSVSMMEAKIVRPFGCGEVTPVRSDGQWIASCARHHWHGRTRTSRSDAAGDLRAHQSEASSPLEELDAGSR
jgi:hypothetical protein